MTPKECFEKWDAQYVTHGGADYRQMIEDIESTNEAHDLVTIHVRLKNGESEDIPSYWK